MFGGLLSGVPQNTLIEINFLTNDSYLIDVEGVVPPARFSHCSVMRSYKMYIFGGQDENGTALTDLWEFNSIF